MTDTNDTGKDGQHRSMTRRGLLMKLGLATTAAYAAPVLLQLNTARASGGSWGSRGSGSGRGRGRGSYSYGSGGRRRPAPRY